jgi:hypothetical protein
MSADRVEVISRVIPIAPNRDATALAHTIYRSPDPLREDSLASCSGSERCGNLGLSVHRMKWLSADGDPLEVLARVVDFVALRPTLVAALACADGAKGGRPPYDSVVMLKVLVLAARPEILARARNGNATPNREP